MPGEPRLCTACSARFLPAADELTCPECFIEVVRLRLVDAQADYERVHARKWRLIYALQSANHVRSPGPCQHGVAWLSCWPCRQLSEDAGDANNPHEVPSVEL